MLETEQYHQLYHRCYKTLVQEYIYGGRLDATYNRIRSQIDSLVEADPNAMYTYEEYIKATDMLYNTITLRSRSVSGQLDGTIPSTNEGQRTDASALVDASGIDTSVMGRFMGGGRGVDGDNNQGRWR